MKKFIVFVLLSGLAIGLLAQDKQTQLEAVMKTYHQYNMFDGAVLVAENGKVIYKGVFGLANREWNIPNTTDTKFMIGSVSKPITAILMLIQAQKGLMKADTARYFIDWLAMNQLGDELYNLKRYEDARIIFEHNAAEFPTRGLPLYSVAKTYEALGKKETALEWYCKAIQLNPNFEEARSKIKELENQK